ncbi:hypothetical protein [Methanobrevibacter arboriphilus]|uniref:hypothetical protein n=1 Tax=Methanobrevibacter arboriphilus TaxID=39441 RepID=UPI0006D2B5EA|nr:hypothetical protein [Methanobrevibacter arboriphilus]
MYGQKKKLNDGKIDKIEFKEYDNDPKLVLKEIKEILSLLKENNGNFSLFNDSIPISASCVLIKYYGG